MELVLISGEACVKKLVKNENIYRELTANTIIGIPEILKVENGIVYYKYVNGETLENRIKNSKSISKEFIRFLIFSCATILENLREVNIVHNDITPENIVITPKGEIYLIDFESATFGNKSKSGFEFNQSEYSSPEVMANIPTTFQSDIYSLGRIIQKLDLDQDYTYVTNKCIKENISDRYSSYIALIHEINSVFSKIENTEEIFTFNNYFSKKMLILIAITVLLGAIIGYYFSGYSQNSNIIMYMLFSIYGTLVFLDLCDYIRVLLFKGNFYKKILPKKFLISFAMFFMTVIISLLLM
ncbi:MAG: protein kinase domain-containing protein [Bacilli bacterium]